MVERADLLRLVLLSCTELHSELEVILSCELDDMIASLRLASPSPPPAITTFVMTDAVAQAVAHKAKGNALYKVRVLFPRLVALRLTSRRVVQIRRGAHDLYRLSRAH